MDNIENVKRSLLRNYNKAKAKERKIDVKKNYTIIFHKGYIEFN